MTDRLYYDNAYLTEFDATVLEIRADGMVRLDRSAFYPTSGGQPYDTGTLEGSRVLDVIVDKGEVWHKVDAPLTEGQSVHGKIDWPRRFDHMQQHGGEHMLAGEVYRQLGGNTIGLHLGHDDSSIDCELPGGRVHLTEEEIRSLEDAVNAHIQADAPCRCWFPSAEELASLPLRKAPTVTEHVRIVAFGDFEMVACGGTHPSTAGQIGLVKIIDARPARGKLRLTFLCGSRAFADYRLRFDALGKAAELLSARAETFYDNVARLKEENYALRMEILKIRRDTALSQVQKAGNSPVLRMVFEGIGIEALREAAAQAISQGCEYALMASKEENGHLTVFARSENAAADMGKLMRASGCKGGGKPDFAQGRCDDIACLETAEGML